MKGFTKQPILCRHVHSQSLAPTSSCTVLTIKKSQSPSICLPCDVYLGLYLGRHKEGDSSKVFLIRWSRLPDCILRATKIRNNAVTRTKGKLINKFSTLVDDAHGTKAPQATNYLNNYKTERPFHRISLCIGEDSAHQNHYLRGEKRSDEPAFKSY